MVKLKEKAKYGSPVQAIQSKRVLKYRDYEHAPEQH